MARKRVIEEPTLKSWEDVNDALRQIAEAQIALGDIESDMQKQIIGAQKVAEDMGCELQIVDISFENLLTNMCIFLALFAMNRCPVFTLKTGQKTC
mgnify:CR=1 FL=1